MCKSHQMSNMCWVNEACPTTPGLAATVHSGMVPSNGPTTIPSSRSSARNQKTHPTDCVKNQVHAIYSGGTAIYVYLVSILLLGVAGLFHLCVGYLWKEINIFWNRNSLSDSMCVWLHSSKPKKHKEYAPSSDLKSDGADGEPDKGIRTRQNPPEITCEKDEGANAKMLISNPFHLFKNGPNRCCYFFNRWKGLIHPIILGFLLDFQRSSGSIPQVASTVISCHITSYHHSGWAFCHRTKSS